MKPASNTINRSLRSTVLIIISVSFLFYAFSTGITGVTLKNGDGCTCHANNPSANVTVTIEGPATLTTGETAAYTVSVSGGPLVRAGTNIAASSGDLTPGDGLQKISGELTHTLPKAPAGGIVTFQFNYTAPATAGEVTLFANGNSVNFNGQNTGDQWNFAANKTVMVQTPTGVKDELFITKYNLEQNYPNPFNPATKIRFSIPAVETGFIPSLQLKVYDILGREVRELVNEVKQPGVYEVEFYAGGLPSGVYIYQLRSGKYFDSKKMILTK